MCTEFKKRSEKLYFRSMVPIERPERCEWLPKKAQSPQHSWYPVLMHSLEVLQTLWWIGRMVMLVSPKSYRKPFVKQSLFYSRELRRPPAPSSGWFLPNDPQDKTRETDDCQLTLSDQWYSPFLHKVFLFLHKLDNFCKKCVVLLKPK